MRKEQELYKDRVVGLLVNFQLLELSLKLYIGSSYSYINSLVENHIYFDFSTKDVENFPLEKLLNLFKKLNDNDELKKRLNKLREKGTI